MGQQTKCEICGKTKSDNEFSKSYKHRCKECVAEHTRQMRAEAKERSERAVPKDERPFRKAVVKSTGETVMVRMCSEPMTVCVKMCETEDGFKIPTYALEYEKEIDWEQRRYETAKAAFQGLLSNSVWLAQKCELTMKKGKGDFDTCAEILKREIAEDAVEFADELIKELKK